MSVGGGYNPQHPQHPHLTPTPLHHFVFCWSNKNNNSNHDSRPDKWVPNMSAVNKSGKLNVNLYNFVPFVGGFSSAQFSSQIVRIPRKSGKMPDLQLIIAVGFAFFNVYLFAFQMPYGWTTIAGRQRGVCPILGLISRWTRPLHRVLRGRRRRVCGLLVYSLSHDFALKLLTKCLTGQQHDFWVRIFNEFPCVCVCGIWVLIKSSKGHRHWRSLNI